jgi:hypothetical protein
MDVGCEQKVASDDVFELQFEHPSGMRAAKCLKLPSRAGVAAGMAAASVVGGTLAFVLGSSLGSSLGGASSAGSSAVAATGTASGLGSLVGMAQFMGLTSDMCAVQGNEEWQVYLDVMQVLNFANLRIPVPAFFTGWSWVFEQLSICGMDPVDLAAQARADVGDLFSGNMLFGFILLSIVTVAHLLFLQPTSVSWRRFIQKNAPFSKLELYVLVAGVPGSASSLALRVVSTLLSFQHFAFVTVDSRWSPVQVSQSRRQR